jgi:hypothetical protein
MSPEEVRKALDEAAEATRQVQAAAVAKRAAATAVQPETAAAVEVADDVYGK